MDNELQQVLTSLQDIKLPAGVSMWPPALGFIIIAVLVAAGCVAFIAWLWLKYKRRYRSLALQELAKIAANAQQQGALRTVQSISILLRRAALTRYKRREVAALNSVAWLKFLDKTAKTQDFSQGIGRLLIDAPYRAQYQQEVPRELFSLVEKWLKSNL